MRRYIAQGEQAIGHEPDDVITTILGSCVAVCLRDPVIGIGGMNHILVPSVVMSDLGARGAGACAMETLINTLLKKGAQKTRLEAKVFGGASIIAGLSDVGLRNSEFVFEYLQVEGISCLSQSVGGTMARQVRFWPHSGRVKQRFVRNEDAPIVKPETVQPTNDLELL